MEKTSPKAWIGLPVLLSARLPAPGHPLKCRRHSFQTYNIIVDFYKEI